MESNEFKHGLLWMDLQHARLVESFNQLHDSCEKGSCSLELLKISKFLESYIQEHFEMEEAYMKKFGYPDYEQHKRAHLKIASDYAKFTQTLLKKEDQVGTELLWLLADWIMKHIGLDDEKVARFLKKKGVK